jgi:hypothetical protein
VWCAISRNKQTKPNKYQAIAIHAPQLKLVTATAGMPACAAAAHAMGTTSETTRSVRVVRSQDTFLLYLGGRVGLVGWVGLVGFVGWLVVEGTNVSAAGGEKAGPWRTKGAAAGSVCVCLAACGTCNKQGPTAPLPRAARLYVTQPCCNTPPGSPWCRR